MTFLPRTENMLRLCVGLREMRLVPRSLLLLPLAAVLPQSTSSCAASNLHARTGVLRLRCLGVYNALLDVAREAEEGLLNVDVAFGRDLHEWYSKLVGKCLALLSRDSALLFPITFVANQDLVDAFSCMLLDVREPRSDVCRSIH